MIWLIMMLSIGIIDFCLLYFLRNKLVILSISVAPFGVSDLLIWYYSSDDQYSMQLDYKFLIRRLYINKISSYLSSSISPKSNTWKSVWSLWKSAWSLLIMPKLKFSLWRAPHNTLPVMTNFSRRDNKFDLMYSICQHLRLWNMYFFIIVIFNSFVLLIFVHIKCLLSVFLILSCGGKFY